MALKISGRVLMLVIFVAGVCASVALMGWQAPLVRDQIIADE